MPELGRASRRKGGIEMAHVNTTVDLGRTRPTTNETQNRPGWSRPVLTVAMAVIVGLAVGAAAWTIAGSQSVSVANRTAYVAAIHEKIETHRALVGTAADRAYDPIESHRTAVANAATIQVIGLRGAIAQFGVLHGAVQDFASLSRPERSVFDDGIRIIDRVDVLAAGWVDPGIQVPDTHAGIPLLPVKVPNWVRTPEGVRALR